MEIPWWFSIDSIYAPINWVNDSYKSQSFHTLIKQMESIQRISVKGITYKNTWRCIPDSQTQYILILILTETLAIDWHFDISKSIKWFI